MIIKCCKNGSELEFSEKDGLSQPVGRESFRATIRSKYLSLFIDVYCFDFFSHLVGFFEDLARNWKGFDGEKEWSSLEGELSLVCTSDKTGHFELEATIRNLKDDSCATKSIYIESGQLDNIALEARRFFNISQK